MDYQSPEIAAIYDCLNPKSEDTNFYVSLAGPQPCAVLDLGCGTGTLCCALAKRGHHVAGVDPAVAMLAIAKRKPFADEVEWVESSAQHYRSQRRFDLIFMTGHAFQTLLSDGDTSAVFQAMRQHVKERGKIAFETRNPLVDWAGEWAGRSRVVHNPSRGELTETLTITANDREFVSFQTAYRFQNRVLTTNSTLRFPSREHVADLISRSGLVVREIFGDWKAGPFEPERSQEMIFVVEPVANAPDGI